MLCFPNCKINIGLFITKRRSDGYHDLETVFFPVPLYDALEIVPAKDTQLFLSGLSIVGDNNNNLIIKALQLLKKEFPNKINALDIYLNKVIPMGAGLGGGSADGAFMLKLLNDFFNLQLNKEELAHYALQLGSDCPFFIYNKPMFATGRGEKMQQITLDLKNYSLQLICPDISISTAAAFSTIIPKVAAFNLCKINELPVHDWRNYIFNDFESGIFNLFPQLAAIKQQLYQQGALYAAMSGTGSTVYGIFARGKQASINIEVGFKSYYFEDI